MTEPSKSIIDAKEFSDTLKRQAGDSRYCLIVGNGINMYWKGLNNEPNDKREQDNQLQWNQLLQNLITQNQNDLQLDKESIDCLTSENITDTERVQLLCAGNAERISILSSKLAETINRDYQVTFEAKHHSALISSAWEGNHHILTTNFDNNIRNYLLSTHTKLKISEHRLTYAPERKSSKLATKSASSSSCSRENRIWGDFQHYDWNVFEGANDSLANGTRKASDTSLNVKHDIWHLHGNINHGKRKYSSVLFSFGAYTNAIADVRKLGSLGSASSRISRTWLYLFMKCPLVFVGLGLSQQEIFLRNLLFARQRYRRQQGLTDENSFYLFSDEQPKNKAGRPESPIEFLSLLNIRSVRFDTFDQMYNFDFSK